MVEAPVADLAGRCILVVEDEYMIATDIVDELVMRHAEVLGPMPTVARALAAVQAARVLDGALLDVNLHGEMIFSVLDVLIARNIPFVLSTGYDEAVIPPRYADAPRCEKPVASAALVKALARHLTG